MTGSAEISLAVFDRLIAEEAVRRRALKRRVQHQTRLGEDPTDAEAELGEIKAILAALRAQQAALRSERRES
jgi:hypothetical protein